MPAPYPIMEVPPEQVRNQGPEAMGSKRKFWFLPSSDTTRWLFKYPQQDTGQHWAEKIAEEVAKQLEIRCAEVELAQCMGEFGSATKSFLRKRWDLEHGNQLLADCVPGYDKWKKFRQSEHTLINIFASMDHIFLKPDAAQQAKIQLADYVVLDALIGNTDRHHENWGILKRHREGKWVGWVAPTFDHASSLGRELLDERRQRFLHEDRVGNYAEKGRGAIYLSKQDRRGPSPLQLVRHAATEYADLFSPMLARLKGLDQTVLVDSIQRVPESWMSTTARAFSEQLIRYNYSQLLELP